MVFNLFGDINLSPNKIFFNMWMDKHTVLYYNVLYGILCCLYKMEYTSAQILKQKRTTDTHNTYEWLNHCFEQKNPERSTSCMIVFIGNSRKEDILY